MPAISAYNGFTENSLNGLTQSLANPRSMELRLAGIRIEEESDDIIQMKHNYFTLANVSNEIGNKSSGNGSGVFCSKGQHNGRSTDSSTELWTRRQRRCL